MKYLRVPLIKNNNFEDHWISTDGVQKKPWQCARHPIRVRILGFEIIIFYTRTNNNRSNTKEKEKNRVLNGLRPFLFAGLRAGTENGFRNENARGHDEAAGRVQASDAVAASRQEFVDVQRENDRIHRRVAPEEPGTAAVSPDRVRVLLVFGGARHRCPRFFFYGLGRVLLTIENVHNFHLLFLAHTRVLFLISIGLAVDRWTIQTEFQREIILKSLFVTCRGITTAY